MSDQPKKSPLAIAESSSVHGVRRPYQKPQLRHLGSVRELTLGTTMGAFQETVGTMLMVGPM